ncbi:sugar-binding domain-containing protein [Limnoglobus roseus]|uniref:GH2 + Glyco_hydro_106 + Abhydrolase_3-retaining glycoside hydrolase n=1 Tax=Limnoglobus roseus TaxID=2598579 RepID=A0A5C1ADT7_9BACT|nr:sugar-binding domain-containing protein [Limnoglobus roseus]QEL16403.1 GH2 + Glyco_hydro_106 + Abhydrolase_3 - retaining glycoside hydrolase [Limnoglobus roseus]
MKSLFRFLLLVVAGFASSIPTRAETRTSFNSDWRLTVGDAKGAETPGFDDATWTPVTLPRAWNEDDAFAKDVHDLRTGVAWYRKRFVLPNDTTGKKVYLEFEGVRHGAEVFVNGTSVGVHENGVMAFGLDITPALKPAGQENVIAVRTDSAWNYRERATKSGYQWSDKNFYANYGGINKNVILHVKDRLHQTLPLYSNLGTTGVYVYAKDMNVANRTATVVVEAQVKNDYAEAKTFAFDGTIDDLNGKRVATFTADKPVTLGPGQTTVVTASAAIKDVQFWSWGYGYLYTVHTSLKVENTAVDTVATRTGFRKTEFARGHVTLNDRAIHLHGYAQRTTNEWPALGSAVPAWMSDHSNRLMVEGGANLVRWMHVTPWKQDVESCDRVGLMQAMPAGDSEKDVTGRRWQQRVELMRDAIVYNRNNPSVILYEAGNAGISDEHMLEMKKVRDQFDPHGGRAIGCRNMLDQATAEYGGDMLYVNKSATKPMWAMEYSRDEALRKYWDALSPPRHKDGDGPAHGKDNPAAYNRNQDTFAVEAVARWYDYYRERPGTGSRVNAGGVNIIFSDSNSHFRGAANYRCSGEVDAVRLPKDGYFANQVMWDGWVDPETPRAHIIGHWNYDPGTVKDVLVVSSAAVVKVSLNGKPLPAATKSMGFLFTLKNVAFEPGTLKAVGVDAAGREVCSTALITAGPPHALRLTPHTGPGGLRADGADVAMVDVEVIDKDGRRCPTALDLVQFSLAGPAEWRGGVAFDVDRKDNYILAKSLPVQCGVNRVLIRSTPTAGAITLKAVATGLPPASVTFTSVAGPSQLLASYLGRGPTPKGVSNPPTRTPLKIARVTAGSKADTAVAATDDNEKTTWTSESKLASAWIECELPAAATVSEITLKLGQFKRLSYPLRVTVDGKEAFNGPTSPTLGYVTLSLKPTSGKAVRIALTGSPKASNAFDMTEVTGATTNDGDAPTPAGKGVLAIIELELYGPKPAESPPANAPPVRPLTEVDVWPAEKMPGNGARQAEADLPAKGDGVRRVTNISKPTLTVFPAPKKDKAAPAVIVCPGGGYSYLCIDKEGTDVAAWLNGNGITAVVLKYRAPNNRGGALQDAQRALSLTRQNAAAWNVDPDRLGIMGFSAGGHLAARASTQFDERSYPALDAVDRLSCRPDFAVLVYPAYLDDKDGHVSTDLNLKAKVPPTLIVHSEDDKPYVPGSKLYHAALDAAGVVHEFKLYPTGGHGYGLRCTRDAKAWPQDALAWMLKSKLRP